MVLDHNKEIQDRVLIRYNAVILSALGQLHQMGAGAEELVLGR